MEQLQSIAPMIILLVLLVVGIWFFLRKRQRPTVKNKERRLPEEYIVVKRAGHSRGFHVFIAFIVILGLVGVYYAVSYSGILAPKPDPIIVSSSAYETAPNDDYTIIVTAQVRNNGGEGNVRVRANLDAFGQSLRKSRIIHLRSGETKTVEIAFPEVTIEPRLFQAILDLLTGGGIRAVTDPDIDFNVWAEPA